MICFAGSNDKDAVCRSLTPAVAETFLVPGGHHFGGNYRLIADRILKEAHVRT